MAKKSEVQLPIFEGNDLARAEQCILWTWRTLKKVNWLPEKIRRLAFRLTPAKMIASGEIFYMNPCSLQTIVCLEALKANGFKPTVIVDLVEAGKGALPHFAIEMQIGGQLHFIEFKTRGTNLVKGSYKNIWIPGLKTRKRIRIPGTRFGLDKPLEAALGARVLALATRHGYDRKQHIARLASDATPQNFRTFQERIHSKIRLKRVIHR